jgi:hypothetical protein
MARICSLLEQSLYESVFFRYPVRKERTRVGGRDEEILLSLFNEA